MDDHQIAPGLHGWLESPLPSAVVGGCVVVIGWAFATGARILDVWVEGIGERRTVPYGMPRDDVARVYQGEPNAVGSGFSGYIEIDRPPAAPIDLEVWAALDDGRTVHLFTSRLDASGDAGAPRPLQVARIVGSSEALARTLRAVLANFLAADSRWSLPAPAAPRVSVIVVVWNRADLTFACLRALAAQRDVPVDVVVVDNASTDETSELLQRIDGLTVVRNAENLGFTVAANIGARAARGEFVLFLNNDAELVPGAVRQLLDTATRTPLAGAVGGKLIFPDGRLQEAGSIVWSDGSCEAYGRGGDPAAPEFNFERRVDFCSAALLLTPRSLFNELGGFDERYRPAYYEDADYCARLWARGYTVVYQPNAAAIHHEFGSAASPDAAVALQRERRPLFASRNRDWLSAQRSRSDDVIAARSHPHGRRSVIFVDDTAPDRRLGAGFPRAAALVRALEELGYLVTIYATAGSDRLRSRHEGLRAVEVVGGRPDGLRHFLASRRHHDLVFVSRPHNMQHVKAAIGADLSGLGVPCIYDAEAVYALRTIGRRQLDGRPMSEHERQSTIDGELALTRGCAGVVVVSEAERRLFADAGGPPVHVVGYAVDAAPTPNPFACRRTLLFVGAFSAGSPNEDAVSFFCRDVLPAIRDGGCHAPLVVAGARIPDSLKAGDESTVAWHSDVDNLTPLYDDARVFVAPTRFAAGIPLKVVEAAARGVPVVCTPLVARQLGWEAGAELLTAERPDEFAGAVSSLFNDRDLWTRLRDAALARVVRDHSPETFRAKLQQALGSPRR